MISVTPNVATTARDECLRKQRRLCLVAEIILTFSVLHSPGSHQKMTPNQILVSGV